MNAKILMMCIGITCLFACKARPPEKLIAEPPKNVSLQLAKDGVPINPDLVLALEGIRGTLTREAAAHFYGELLKSTLLVPVPGQPTPFRGVTREATPTAVRMIVGPDGKQWFPAFTDAKALQAHFAKGSGFIALPAMAIAKMILKDPATPGLVLNQTTQGGGQPVERKGLEAVARNQIPQM